MALLATLVLAATATSRASAARGASPDPAAFALSPVSTTGALRLRGLPAQVLHGAILVRDVSGHPVTVILQPADIKNASNGNADYVTGPLSQAGRWLHLTATRVRLVAHGEREVMFAVRVPARAAGALHYAGIVAINAADLSDVAGRKTNPRRTFTFHRVDRQALPVTIRLPGPLWRRLALGSARIVVAPVGAGLVLGLRPGASELIEEARIKLRAQRSGHTVFRYASTLGQLFPGAPLYYRIPWRGLPTEGAYQVRGFIRPEAPVKINRTIEFTGIKAAQLRHEASHGAGLPASGMPGWVWVALAGCGSVVIMLLVALWRLARRSVQWAA